VKQGSTEGPSTEIHPNSPNSPAHKCFISWGRRKPTKMDRNLQTSTPDRPPRMPRIRIQSTLMKPSLKSNLSDVRNRPQIDRNPLQIHRKSTPNCPGIYLNFFVLDVMLQSISSHRREAASPVLPPQLHLQNAVTL
jgi:hypothetical protein